MTGRLLLPLGADLAGVRILLPKAEPGPEAARVRWLLDLRSAGERRLREHEALVGTLQSIRSSLQPLPGMVEERLDRIAAMTAELGMALAREIVGAALDRGICDPTPVVAHCLRDAVRNGGGLRVRLHPADLGGVLERIEARPELRELAEGVDFSADPALHRGAVRAETDTGRLVYDPEEILERLCQEIRREVGV